MDSQLVDFRKKCSRQLSRNLGKFFSGIRRYVSNMGVEEGDGKTPHWYFYFTLN